MSDEADRLAEILADGLDLCVRARKLDQLIETIPSDHSDNPCNHPIMRSYTPPLWVRDQYDADLEAWEAKARALMTELGYGER